MADNLVIVESPAKAKTIGKFLGSKYKVVASNGHVRDLPKSQLGVDEANDFEPKYITLRGRGEVLDRIRREAKGAPLPALCVCLILRKAERSAVRKHKARQAWAAPPRRT